jgi:hypothetical protein
MSDFFLPRRDRWLLPLISVLTVVGMLVVAEAASRVLYPEQLEDACKVPDPEIGARFTPNCTATLKAAEGPWVTSHYNALGNRAELSWAAYPADTKRVAVVGTSVAQGYLLAYEQTTGATLARDLSHACHAPVEAPNIGANGFFADRVVRRVHDALELKPQAILLMFVPNDLLSLTADAPANAVMQDAPVKQETSPLRRMVNFVKSSRAVTVAQHFFVRNPELYIPLYLNNGDTSDFLRVPFKPRWKQRLEAFDVLLGRLSDLTHAAGVPLTMVYVPQEAQAVLAERHTWPPGVDPFAFGAKIGELAAKHGIIYHDATADFGVMANPQDAYYAVDGHISGEGQVIIGDDLARLFIKEVPAFAKCSPSTVAAAAGNP